ncbi:unnamed protein product [Protopolystoma xenopodis]|uniref:Uncharacterized protein n=1 Tax=Protopolystoma xenopodis TaxID=117903 RepID=A0A448X4I7_9PLAT|nr:unnamed protein product [Protopolystoma xenopodis]
MDFGFPVITGAYYYDVLWAPNNVSNPNSKPSFVSSIWAEITSRLTYIEPKLELIDQATQDPIQFIESGVHGYHLTALRSHSRIFIYIYSLICQLCTCV